MTRLLAALLRRLSLFLVRLYYPRLRIEGAERIPTDAPVIFVLNHPNGLLDPLVLAVALARPVRFLAKHTLFSNPLGRLAMEAFGSFPVYRSQDTGGVGGTARNETTFASCRQALRAKQWLALFPEGVSHSDPQLRPLKPGAARIALSAEHEHDLARAGPLGLRIVPVGLFYEEKAVFRSRVLLVVGQPLAAADWSKTYAGDERRAADELTAAIRTALGQVVLQADTRELLDGIAHVALWTAEGKRPDPAEVNRRSREITAAYHTLREQDPEGVDTVVEEARSYARVLRHLGVTKPWALEYQPVRAGRAARAIAGLLLLAPLAAAGVVLGWGPYRLAGVVAARVTSEEDLLGTIKLLGGALFLLLGWVAETALGWWWSGPGGAAAVVIAAPICSYAALRFGEAYDRTREAARHLWLRGDQARRLAERRRSLAAHIARALQQVPQA